MSEGIWGNNPSKAIPYINESSLPDDVKGRLMDAVNWLHDVREDYPRLRDMHGTVYPASAMSKEERQVRYTIAKMFGIRTQTARRIRQFGESYFFRWIIGELGRSGGQTTVCTDE